MKELSGKEKQEILEQIAKEQDAEYWRQHTLKCPKCGKSAHDVAPNGAGILEESSSFSCDYCGWDQDLESNENLRYLYWLDDDGNVGFCKERQEDKELASIDVLVALECNDSNFVEKFANKYTFVVKEGIYALKECNHSYGYDKIESFEDKYSERHKRNFTIKSYIFEED